MKSAPQWRSPFVHIIAGLLAALPAAAPCAVAAEHPPNILLIVSDDQGYADLGCYGSTEIRTPHLDRLAAEGVRLTSFYVTWPACTPSRGSLLTGRYPQRNGTYDMFRNEAPDYGHRYSPDEYAATWERIGGMDTREVLLPALLKRARRTAAPEDSEQIDGGAIGRASERGGAKEAASGPGAGAYVCGIFGKWDLGMHRRFLPLQRGFDSFYGLVNTGIDYYTHERYGVPSMYRDNEPTTGDRGTYATDIFHREAARFIEQSAAADDRPFLCYVPYNAPHTASSLDPKIRSAAQGPDEFKRLYPHLLDADDEFIERVNRRTGEREQIASPRKRRLEYLAAVSSMDDSIGGLLDLLDRHNLADRTIVIFFSDNGGGAGADNSPLRGGKSRMWEGGIRVPAIVRWPGMIPPGTVSDEFLTALEIVPTLLAAAGAQPPEGLVLDGFDMTAVLAGREPSRRTEMFWQRRGDRAARVGQWKWVHTASRDWLFDLSSDTGEQHDLASEQPEVLAMVKQRFAAWEKQMADAESRGPFRDY